MRAPAGIDSRHSREARPEAKDGDGMNFAGRIYRRLAQAFPQEFKMAYGAELLQRGDDVVQDLAKRHGAPGLIRLIADIAVRLPFEYLAEMRQDMRYALR